MFTSSLGVLTIPEGFSSDVQRARNGGAGPVLDLEFNNMNSDMAKNVRLYLTQVTGEFYRREYANVDCVINEDLSHGLRVPWFTEIGLGVVMFSVSLAGMFNGSSSLLREFEENTIKELLLSPRPKTAIVAGKAILAVTGAIASGGFMYLVVTVLAGQRPGPYWPLGILAVLLVGITFTAVGLVFGLVFKRYIPAAFCSVLTGFVS